jgi:hypothetical protein
MQRAKNANTGSVLTCCSKLARMREAGAPTRRPTPKEIAMSIAMCFWSELRAAGLDLVTAQVSAPAGDHVIDMMAWQPSSHMPGLCAALCVGAGEALHTTRLKAREPACWDIRASALSQPSHCVAPVAGRTSLLGILEFLEQPPSPSCLHCFKSQFCSPNLVTAKTRQLPHVKAQSALGPNQEGLCQLRRIS